MAEWIKVNGDITTVEPKNGTDFKLDELQKYVDGRIEIVPTKDGRIIVLGTKNHKYFHSSTSQAH
jgi:hypothetical protein